MAIFHITTATSRFTNTAGQDAFGGSGNPNDDTPGPDTLIVDQGAYLAAGSNAFFGADLANTGAWTVTINGSVLANDPFLAAIRLKEVNPGVSTVTIGAEGEVFGVTSMELESDAIIKNFGLIVGEGVGIFAQAKSTTLTNSGEIDGGIDFNSRINKVTNPGLIVGPVRTNNDTLITNSGEIDGLISLEDGINKLTNSGHISGDVDLNLHIASIVGESNTVINSGTIVGNVLGGGSPKTLINSGKIEGLVNLGDSGNTLTNSGEIDGSVGFGFASSNKLTNTGTITGDVNGGNNDDTFINSGTITGEVRLNVGNDVFTDFVTDAIGVVHSGSLLTGIDLGEGEDKFFGGSKAETVADSFGDDLYKFGGGDDVYKAVTSSINSAIDTVDGGPGSDTYDALPATHDAVKINLDSVFHSFSLLLNDPSTYGDVAANTATGADVAGLNEDIVTNFENVIGGFGDDVIYGNAAANFLRGEPGNDALFGFAGNDTLIGGDGEDLLYGGAGKDMLSGGPGNDKFIYGSIKDSGTTKATRDVITDFEPGSGAETINLSLIDANTKVAGDQAFTYVNNDSSATPFAMFDGAPGELRSYWNAGGQMIEGDVNGDKVADFSIQITDPTHVLAIHYYDFVR